MLAELTPLRADFPDWHFQHLDARVLDLCWEAKRTPLKFPEDGGISWVRARTAARLRELLEGIAQIEAGR